MRWYHFVAWFFGGAFLCNAVPHFVMGVTGQAFQSPFAHPPGIGLSSATTNTLWGFANLVVGYLLTARVGRFEWRRTSHVAVFALGALLMAYGLAHHFGEFHGGRI